MPTVLFEGDCSSRDVSFVGVINDYFPDSGRKNPVFVRANMVELDSRVITISISASEIGEREITTEEVRVKEAHTVRVQNNCYIHLFKIGP